MLIKCISKLHLIVYLVILAVAILLTIKLVSDYSQEKANKQQIAIQNLLAKTDSLTREAKGTYSKYLSVTRERDDLFNKNDELDKIVRSQGEEILYKNDFIIKLKAQTSTGQNLISDTVYVDSIGEIHKTYSFFEKFNHTTVIGKFYLPGETYDITLNQDPLSIAVRVTQDKETGLLKSYVKLYGVDDEDAWIESMTSALSIDMPVPNWYEKLRVGTIVGMRNGKAAYGFKVGYDKFSIGQMNDKFIFISFDFNPFKKLHSLGSSINVN